MSNEAAVLEHRLNSVERAVEKIADAVQEIASNTTQIAKLEVRHAETRDSLERAFDEIGRLQGECAKFDDRLKVIEVEMPGLKETRALVMKGILVVLGVVALAVIGLVIPK